MDLTLENGVSYSDVSVTLHSFFFRKKQAAVLRLSEGGLMQAGTGPAQLPVTQPQAMLAVPGDSTTLSSPETDIS